MIQSHKKKTALAVSLAIIFISTGAACAFHINRTNMKGLAKNAKAQTVQAADSPQSQETVPPSADSAANPPENNPPIENSQPAAVPATVNTQDPGNNLPVHTNISTTYFWAGEAADGDNKNISNVPSAWDDDWTQHFGGVDDPKKRNGFVAASFTPKENSFYFALPYNDFDSKGSRKKDVSTVIPWASSKKWADTDSMCKDQWIQITKGGKTAYAQWEDVGPFGENDSAYVFGNASPKSKTNEDAGLDVSPAVKDFLSLGDVDKTDWQFVRADQVPDGPWKKTVTTSQIYWN